MPPISTVVLLASPFLGPASWAPVATELRAHGLTVTVPGLPRGVATPHDVLAGWLPQLPDDDLVLVPHSNAGLYVAALAAARPVRGLVFVDAGLPSDGPTTPTAPAGLRETMAGLAGQDALLPPWTRWWPEESLEGLFPDPVTQARVEAEQPLIPLGYLAAQVPSPPGWETLPAAYLGFGDTYADEQASARARGWPVETVAGRHLHQLVDPAAVADAVLRLGHLAGRAD
jgi:pimeloyl-ACP methyl ester carboxylesterase